MESHAKVLTNDCNDDLQAYKDHVTSIGMAISCDLTDLSRTAKGVGEGNKHMPTYCFVSPQSSGCSQARLQSQLSRARFVRGWKHV